MARWLLETQDRVGDEVPLTQEYLAQMLGVRRSYLNRAAKALQAAGLIHYHRGVVTITHRIGLEQTACECYKGCVLIIRTFSQAYTRVTSAIDQRLAEGVYRNRIPCSN